MFPFQYSRSAPPAAAMRFPCFMLVVYRSGPMERSDEEAHVEVLSRQHTATGVIQRDQGATTLSPVCVDKFQNAAKRVRARGNHSREHHSVAIAYSTPVSSNASRSRQR